MLTSVHDPMLRVRPTRGFFKKDPASSAIGELRRAWQDNPPKADFAKATLDKKKQEDLKEVAQATVKEMKSTEFND